MTHYKFVSWDVPAFETILTGRIPAALLAAERFTHCNTYPGL